MSYNEKDLVTNSKGQKEEIKLKFVKLESKPRLLLYTIDSIFISLSFLFFSLGGSTFINSFICKKLDTTKSKLELFFETTYETLIIIFLIYLLVFFVPQIPSIVPYPNHNHIRFRMLVRHVVVAAAVIFAHERLFNKYRFLFSVDDN